MEKWMKNGTFGEKRWKNGRKNGRKTALFFTKIQSPVSGVEKWGDIEVSGGLRKIGDFIGLIRGPARSHKTQQLREGRGASEAPEVCTSQQTGMTGTNNMP